MHISYKLSCALILVPVTVQAAPTYNYVDLGTFGGTSSQAISINNSGHVVGWAQSSSQGQVQEYNWRTGVWSVYTATIENRNAFVYDRGQMINLGKPSEWSEAWAINDNNRIVGFVGNGEQRAFRLKYGPFNETANLSSFVDPSISGTWASAVNNRNETVVNSIYSGQTKFIYQNNTATNVGPLLGAPSWQRGINNSGLVVGDSFLDASSTGPIHAMSYDIATGQVTDLGMLPIKPIGTYPNDYYYYRESHAYGVNDSGAIVGTSYTDVGLSMPAEHAFAYEAGAMRDLGVLPGTDRSDAFAINNHGTIVGRSGWRGFVFEDGTMLDLNELANVPEGWSIMHAWDINDNGQIVGFAQLLDSWGGTTHAILLDPIGTGSGNLMPQSESLEPYQSIYLADAGTFSASVVNVPLPEPVPEPTCMAALGLAGVLLARRTRAA